MAASERIRNSLRQFGYLRADMQRVIGGRWWRWYGVIFTSNFIIVLTYRLSRALYLLMGKYWSALYLLLSPIRFLTRAWTGNAEIHYGADIGPGLAIFHPSLGVVVSKHTIAGTNLTLMGGNCIGRGNKQGSIKLGNNVVLSTQANVLGPVTIGNDVTVGMGAVVTHDAADGETLVGIPAKPIPKKAEPGSPIALEE